MKLSDQQIEAAEMLAEGSTKAATALQLGVSEHTIYRWQRLPEFVEAVKVCREFNQKQAALATYKQQIREMTDGIRLLLNPSVPAIQKITEATRLLSEYGELA